MDSAEVLTSLRSFVETTQAFIGPLTLSRYHAPIDARNFHLEYKALSQELGDQDGRVSGLYVYHAKKNGVVLYVGISNDIYTRFLQHIGPGYAFGESGSFPHFKLVELYHSWCSEEAAYTLKSGDFFVEAIRVQPFEAARLLEAFILYRGFVMSSKPELNASF